MFAKLLKHDFRSSWGLLGVLSLIALGAGAAGSGLIRYIDNGTNGDIWEVLSIISMMVVIFYLIAYSIAAMFILLGRFYKSRFTDEGYLTFTLPVTTHQVLLSSFLNCFLGLLVAMVVTVASFGIFAFFGIKELDGERMEFIRLCFQRLPEVMTGLGWGNVLLGLLTMLAGVASEIMTIMLAITIGSVIARKHKILAAVGVYYGLHIALSILSTAVLGGTLWAEYYSENLFFRHILPTALIQAVGMAAACYFVMYYLTHKKLNLN